MGLPVEDVILNNVILKVGVLRSKAGGYKEVREVIFWEQRLEAQEGYRKDMGLRA